MTKQVVRILSIRKARKVVNRIRVYAVVQSISRGLKLNHITVLYSRRSGRCACEGNFLGGHECQHLVAVKRAAIRKRLIAA